MEEISITCRYRQTLKELSIGLRNSRIASGRRRRSLIFLALILVFLALIVRHPSDLIFPLGFGIIGGLAGYWLKWRAIRNSPWRDQDVAYTLDEAGYTFEAPSIHSRVEWPRVSFAQELSSGFIFFMGPNKRIYIWLPKHGFTSAEDIDLCRALLHDHTKDFRSLG